MEEKKDRGCSSGVLKDDRDDRYRVSLYTGRGGASKLEKPKIKRGSARPTWSLSAVKNRAKLSPLYSFNHRKRILGYFQCIDAGSTFPLNGLF